MRSITVIFACATYTVYGQQVQVPIHSLQKSPHAEDEDGVSGCSGDDEQSIDSDTPSMLQTTRKEDSLRKTAADGWELSGLADKALPGMGLRRMRSASLAQLAQHTRPAALHTAAYVPGADGTYSQNYQDLWISHIAEKNGWNTDPNAFFLDLGAFKGFECSNSALVESKFGWKGICVEPRPTADAFVGRTCALANRALARSTGESVRFYGTPGTQLQHINKQSIDRSDDAGEVILTLSVKDLLACIDKSGKIGLASPPPQICDRTPQHTLDVPEFINFVSVDVENQEVHMLRSFPFDKVNVGAWVIETSSDEVDNILLNHGYQRVDVQNPGVDRYYIGNSTLYDDSFNKKEWRVHPDGSHGC